MIGRVQTLELGIYLRSIYGALGVAVAKILEREISGFRSVFSVTRRKRIDVAVIYVTEFEEMVFINLSFLASLHCTLSPQVKSVIVEIAKIIYL